MFDAVAEFTLGEREIPEAALDMAATLLIDTLGVAAGAAALDAGRIVRDHAVRFQAAGLPDLAAPILFDGRMAAIPGAAFAAASQIDNLDAHDGFNPTKGHIGCAVVPALCAFAAQRPGLTGPEALRTLVISYEIAARAGIALHKTVSDYHTSGAWNALGVAALGCRIRSLGAEELRQALGIAEYHGPRSQMMREIAHPTMLHDGSGMGALTGCQAVFLAEDGFEGAPAITVEAEEVAPIWQDLGQRWTIMENYIKPYPICRWAHAALDATGEVMTSHSLAPGDIETVEVGTFREAAALYQGMPHTTSQAQYSLAFALAHRVLHGRIGPEHITGAALSDREVAAFLSRIRIHEVARHSERFPLDRCSDVTIVTRDGRRLASGDVIAKGGQEAPLSLVEIEEKFHLMATSLTQARRAGIWDMRRRLQDQTTPFSDLLDLLTEPVE
ncbi:MAG: MmgE/PrpD family protein [Pseudomonadota bacterium]